MTRAVRKNPLQSGFFLITGEQGAGKTSCATAFLCADYRRHRKWRVERARELARQYYAASGVKLHISENLYFSSHSILLDKRRGIETHYIDVQRLGLPNPDYDVQYLPRGSVIFIQEADLQLFCRDWNELNAYLIALLKFVRHNLLTVFFDCQVGGMIDKAVRRLAVGWFHIVSSYTRRFFLFWKPRTWKFIYIENQLNDVLKELSQVGVKLKISAVQSGKFRYFGGVFERYDSFSGARYFLQGIEKVGYEYLPHPKSALSIQNIDDYCRMHPLVKPEETKKGSTKALKYTKKELCEFLAEANGMRYCSLFKDGAFCSRTCSCADCPELLRYAATLPTITD